ncbi:MAG: hypothetical protein KY429_10530 [Actinobacteria bacterium]|nr:hypothetical protein [Actinomycetota bacterium]
MNYVRGKSRVGSLLVGLLGLAVACGSPTNVVSAGATPSATPDKAESQDGHYVIVGLPKVQHDRQREEGESLLAQARGSGYSNARLVLYQGHESCGTIVEPDQNLTSYCTAVNPGWVLILEGPLEGVPPLPEVRTREQADAFSAWHQAKLAEKQAEAQRRGFRATIGIGFYRLSQEEPEEVK